MLYFPFLTYVVLKPPAKEETLLRKRCCFPSCLPVCADRKHLLRKHFLLLRNILFLQQMFPRLHGEKTMFPQHCFRNNVSSFAGAFSSLYNFPIDRINAIIHTRLCSLNYYLFKIGCRESPVCLCGPHPETVKHYFFYCPLFSALRTKLPPSAARILADRWTTMFKSQILSAFLFGAPFLSLKQNSDFFFHVQSFISESMRFHRNVKKCMFHLLVSLFTFCASVFCFSLAVSDPISFNIFVN